MDLTRQSPSVNSARMTVLGTSTRTIGSEIVRTIGSIGAVAVALGMGITAASAPAMAAPTASGGHMYVYIDPATPKTTRVTVEGVFPMSEADAVGYLNNIYTGKEPGGMEYRIFADDNGDGDRTIVYRWVAGSGSFPGYVIGASPDGLGHSFVFNVSSDVFNEDDGPFDFDDEIYAEATFVDADGGRRSQISNAISAQF